MSEDLSGSIGSCADTPDDGLLYSDDNGDNGTDATDRRAVLAIAMETFSGKEKSQLSELNFFLFFNIQKYFFIITFPWYEICVR